MKPKFYQIFIYLFFIFLTGCKTAGKLYQKGDYTGAVNLAVKELQKSPGDPEKITLLKNAYKFAIGDHERKIRNLHSGNNELKWEWIHSEYASLQNLYTAIRKSPEVYEIIQPKDYSSELITYGEKAGDIHVERGFRYMKQHDKQSAKNAYREFKYAQRFKPGDLEIRNWISDAYNAAVTRVMIIPAEQFGFRYSSYNYELQQFGDDLIRNLRNSNKEFLEFYSSRSAYSNESEPDHIVKMNFTRMNLGRIRDRESKREVTKEVVIKEIIYRPDSIVKEYGKVKAIITTTNRTLNADGLLQIEIRDNNGRYLWSDNIIGKYDWNSEFSTYTGDERALSEQDKQLVNRNPPVAPHESETIRMIKNDISYNVLNKLKNFYSRY